MIRKLGEAIYLLVNHFGLIAAVILTVHLPGNLLINYLFYFAPAPQSDLNVFRATTFIEGVFGPIYIGALIHVLWQIKQEQAVGYGEAIGVGLKNWGRLFVARFAAGLHIMIGLVALVIPGVVLALRYSLLDCAVIVEGAGPTESRGRSTQLTEGIKLQILIMSVLFFVGFVFASAMIYFPIYFAAEMGQLSLPLSMGLEVAADCVLDLVYAILQIAVFLYYWDMRVIESFGDESEPCPGDNDDLEDFESEPTDLQDDANPYRSPQM